MLVAMALLALFQWGLPVEDASRTVMLGLEISVVEEKAEVGRGVRLARKGGKG